jgi:type IV pilus assembly protein PilQ
LKSDADPDIRQEGNSILVSPPAGSDMADANLDEPNFATTTKGATIETLSSKPTEQRDPEILGNKNFDAFLLGQNKFYGKPISLQVRDADIRDAFNFIAEESGLNIVLTDNLKFILFIFFQ